MRWTLRALALASLAASGLSLYLDVMTSRGNPCPRGSSSIRIWSSSGGWECRSR